MLLTSIFISASNIKLVKANGIIYIKADGSIDPPTASILNVENISYIFTNNIYAPIIVERDNIVIDGAGYTLEGAGSGTGIDLTNRSNITIKNMEIKTFNEGIRLYNSSNNTIFRNNLTTCNWYTIFAIWAPNNCILENNIANSGDGIWFKGLSSVNNIISRNNVTANKYNGIGLSGVSNNSILGNNIANNSYGIWIKLSSSNNIVSGNRVMSNHICGIWFRESSNNTVSHNNFINQTQQTHSESSQNVWDDGYPSGGNYWSDYSSIDVEADGIGDMPYAIDVNNTDRYPLIAPINIFDAGVWNEMNYHVDIISNSTVSDFYFNPNEGAFLSFKATGESGTSGFCRVAIPKSMLWAEDGWIILVGEHPIVNYTIIPDENYTYLYFTYSHITKTILIQGTHVIPEFTLSTILLLFILIILIFMLPSKKSRKSKPEHPMLP